MAEENFQKTPKKANRWFRAAIVLALLYGITFSLNSLFNWLFFFASAYSFFMAYYLLPVQPRIFQEKKRQTWGGPAESSTVTDQTAQQDVAAKIKRFVFTIVGGIFALLVVFFIIGILSPDNEQNTAFENETTTDLNDASAADMIARGYDFYNKKEYDSSYKSFERALTIESDNAEAAYGKGIVLYAKNRSDEAETLFRRAYEGGFRYAWLSWVLADIHEKRGEIPRAIMFYKESAGLDSSYYDCYKRLADLEPSKRAFYLALAEKHTPN